MTARPHRRQERVRDCLRQEDDGIAGRLLQSFEQAVLSRVGQRDPRRRSPRFSVRRRRVLVPAPAAAPAPCRCRWTPSSGAKRGASQGAGGGLHLPAGTALAARRAALASGTEERLGKDRAMSDLPITSQVPPGRRRARPFPPQSGVADTALMASCPTRRPMLNTDPLCVQRK